MPILINALPYKFEMERRNSSIKYDNEFDCQKINYYFRNQTEQAGFQGQFVDPYFPPNEASLLAKDMNGDWIGDDSSKDVIDPSKIVWRTASQIFDNVFNLFDDNFESRLKTSLKTI